MSRNECKDLTIGICPKEVSKHFKQPPKMLKSRLRKKIKETGQILDVTHFEGNENELKRAKYILNFLQTHSKSEARKCSGLGKNDHKSIIEMFADRGTFYDSKRSGAPEKYSDSKMKKAVKVLLQNEGRPMTRKALVQKLIDDGSIHTNASPGRFLKKFKKHVQAQKHRLMTNSRSTTFFISHNDSEERLRYCKQLLSQLEGQWTLKNLVFCDEVILEESPHPKGKCHEMQA